MNETRYIAIVDDHTMLRKGLMALINLFPNYKVLFDASNGEELVRWMRSKPAQLPEILLLDIVMPVMDGYATAAWVRDHLPSVKVLALSTMDAESAIIRMIRSGARGYILKDADPVELKRAFDEVLQLGHYYSEFVSKRIIQSINRLTDEGSELGNFARLTDRELTFLKAVCSEKTYKEIAEIMYVSERTVDGYRNALFEKLNVNTRVGLVLYAIRNGIVRV